VVVDPSVGDAPSTLSVLTLDAVDDQLHVAPVSGGAVRRRHYASRCRRCGSSEQRRSRTQNVFERLRGLITRRRPYRCDRCGLRRWHRRLDPVVAPVRAASA